VRWFNINAQILCRGLTPGIIVFQESIIPNAAKTRANAVHADGAYKSRLGLRSSRSWPQRCCCAFLFSSMNSAFQGSEA